MFSAYEWFSVAQTLIMLGAGYFTYRLTRVSRSSATTATVNYRLAQAEEEIKQLRNWKHNILVPWQQELEARLDDRFVTRREYEARNQTDDTPWPKNRRRVPRE